jgi:hypothetical protein
MWGCSWWDTETHNYEWMLTWSDIYPWWNGKKFRTYTWSSTPWICEWTCNEWYIRENNNNYCTIQ